jgi:D-serine deaminase-like pyridoxal phosphate-dependent protein
MAHEFVERNRLWARLAAAVRDSSAPLTPPICVVDLDAFEANAADLARRAAGKPIRVASKSLRVPALLRRALAIPGFSGVLTYSLAEALWLHEEGVAGDLVVAYPTVDRRAMRELVTSPSAAAAVTLMVDSVAHLDLVDSVRHSKAVPVRVAIDIDAGLRMGRQHVGPKRSPLYDPGEVVALAREVLGRPGFRLVGVMTYEGQVAGVPDEVPHHRARSAVVRRLKAASLSQLGVRRRELADALETALRDAVALEFWNAGGSGSVAEAAADPVVTEVSAGSGLLGPALFDHYQSFTPTPAAFFGVPVTRRPSPQIATVHGGGLVASGPAGDDRLPVPWSPPGLHLTSLEGAGEVQTPLTGHPAALLRVGDLVWFRHAKSGELFEHANEVQLVRGSAFEQSVATYRGLGHVF